MVALAHRRRLPSFFLVRLAAYTFLKYVAVANKAESVRPSPSFTERRAEDGVGLGEVTWMVATRGDVPRTKLSLGAAQSGVDALKFQKPEESMVDRPWFREIDHTADVGIEVRAPTVKLLFERAAAGMFTILVSGGEVRSEVERRVSVEASDRDALMVRWLSELNYLHQVEQLIFGSFEIDSIDEHHLVARVSGEHYDCNRHTIECEIKAVTFHDMKIIHDRNEWQVQIIFDM